MTILVKIFNCKKLLIIFAKNSTLGIWQRSEYDSELLNLLRLYKFRYLPLNHKKVLRHCLLSLLLLLMMIMMLMMMMMSYLLVHLTVKRVFPGATIAWNFHQIKPWFEPESNLVQWSGCVQRYTTQNENP